MTAIPNDRKIRKEQIIGVVKEIQDGTNITVDDTDPERPIISASGGGGVESVTGDMVDDTDPANPVINYPSVFEEFENFTPTIVDSAGDVTYTLLGTPVGVIRRELFTNNTFIEVKINLSSTSGSTGSGSLQIGGFPFTFGLQKPKLFEWTSLLGSSFKEQYKYRGWCLSTQSNMWFNDVSAGDYLDAITFTESGTKEISFNMIVPSDSLTYL